MGNGERQQQQRKKGGVAQRCSPTVGHCVGLQKLCQLSNLVRHTDKQEGSDDEVEDLIRRDQHQHAVGVGRQPDMILCNKKLEGEKKEKLKVAETVHVRGMCVHLLDTDTCSTVLLFDTGICSIV